MKKHASKTSSWVRALDLRWKSAVEDAVVATYVHASKSTPHTLRPCGQHASDQTTTGARQTKPLDTLKFSNTLHSVTRCDTPDTKLFGSKHEDRHCLTSMSLSMNSAICN
eukprot:3687174-Amphidinium_carterae.1